MKGPAETDAAFLVRRFDALRLDPFAREAIYDALDVPMILAPGPDTPATHPAKLARPPGPLPDRTAASPTGLRLPEELRGLRSPLRAATSRPKRGSSSSWPAG